MEDRLTPEQEVRVKEFYDKYMAIGLDITPINHSEAEILIVDFYKELGRKPPKIHWADSPYHCEKIFKAAGGEADINWWYGQHNVNWVAYYDYFYTVFGLMPTSEKLLELLKKVTNLHWLIPCETNVFLVEKPIKLYYDMQNKYLHKDMAKAVEYKDGTGVYILHGIKMPEHIVMTPWDKLDCNLIVSEKNVDIRRELVRKIGYERLVKELNIKTIGGKYKIANNPQVKFDVYELIDLGFNSDTYRPFLKMTNASLDVYHFEGVAPECKNTQDALLWRYQNQFKLEDIIAIS